MVYFMFHRIISYMVYHYILLMSLVETFHNIVNCCSLWQRHIKNILSEFLIMLIAGTLFSIYIIQKCM